MQQRMNSGRLPALSDPVRGTAAIHIPFPARLSPYAERARQHTLQWAQAMGLLTGQAATEEYDALRLERLMAYFYPDARPTDLELAADFNAWFFIFDDQFDGQLGRRPEIIAQVVDSVVRTMTVAGREVTETAPRPLDRHAPALVRGFQDIWHRATAGTPLHWQHRFRRHWQAYLTAHQGEAHNRTADRLPPLGEFLRLRRDSIGVQPCLDFTERCGGYTVPEELHRAFPLAQMRRITADVVIFVNDIVSLGKELAAGDVNNSVIILREQMGSSLEEAAERIAACANARVARLTRLATTALPKALDDLRVSPEVRGYIAHYVDGMRHLAAGNLAWSLATSRYDAADAATASGSRCRPWAHLAARREVAAGGVRGEA